MSSRPWYKWYPGDFANKTTLLTLEERGAYRDLLDYLWINGPIEPTPRNLASVWKVSGQKAGHLWRRIEPFFSRSSRDLPGGEDREKMASSRREDPIEDGEIDHPKIAKQRAELAEKSKKARKAGRKGGLANARATRAGARAGTDPEPEKDLDLIGDVGGDSNSGGGLRAGAGAHTKSEKRSGRKLTSHERATVALDDWARERGIAAHGLEDDARAIRAIVDKPVRRHPKRRVEGGDARLVGRGSTRGPADDGGGG